ncbi:MAG TPA: methionyl-tRNA formyltransferase, partial [Geothrix sp.]|nr:methionyl-tRNA formyltransferase [Geothrix sp.]
MTRIAFLGTPRAAVPALRALAEEGVEAVFCNPDRPAGRGRHLEAPPVKVAALELGLPLHQPLDWKSPETRERWEALKVDLAVVVAYGHLLPRWMLDSCALGVWNLHFSLLPRWRGAAPVNHALLAGDEETGVSLMRLTPGLDEGPVLAQSRRDIGHEDTAESLLAALATDAAELLMDQLPLMLCGCARPEEQRHELATYASKLRKDMGHLDWRRSAADLHRQVRALWP